LFLDGIHNFLRRADARGSADIVYHISDYLTLIASFAGQA